jgi:hypothetical protein
MVRDEPLLTNDGTNNSFKPLSADTIAKDNEYPASSNTEPTITAVIMIVFIEGKFLDIIDDYLFIYIKQFESYHLKYK